jgi:hypothetical protein
MRSVLGVDKTRPGTKAVSVRVHRVSKRPGGRNNLKGTIMKISRIALLAGLGTVAMTLPAAAARVATDGTDVRAASPAYMQLAQANATRSANEARGGDFKKPKKATKDQK